MNCKKKRRNAGQAQDSLRDPVACASLSPQVTADRASVRGTVSRSECQPRASRPGTATRAGAREESPRGAFFPVGSFFGSPGVDR